MALNSINLPNFKADYDFIDTLDGQESAVREGLGFYKALALLVKGDMAWSVDKGQFFSPNKATSVSKVCEAHGWSKAVVSKAAQVIRHYVEGYEAMSAAELREQVLGLLANFGSVNAAYATINPPKDGDEGGRKAPQAKSARELLMVALRRHVSDGGSVEDFITLAEGVVADYISDQHEGE